MKTAEEKAAAVAKHTAHLDKLAAAGISFFPVPVPTIGYNTWEEAHAAGTGDFIVARGTHDHEKAADTTGATTAPAAS